MIIKSVHLENFMSYENQDFNFSPGCHMIYGINNSSKVTTSNAVGKSSLVESIPFIFFNKSTRGNNLSRNGNGNCLASIEFSIGNDDYKITRFIKHKSGKSVEIIINGEEITGRTVYDLNNQIQSIIGITYELFVSTCVILQGLPVNFSSMTPTSRKVILEELLGFQIWNTYSSRVSNYLKVIDKNYNILQDNFNDLQKKVISLSSKIETMDNLSQSLSEDLTPKILDLKSKIKDINNNISLIEEDIKNYDISTINSDINIINNKISKNEYKLSNLKSFIDSGVCPTCNRPYDNSYLEKVKEDYAEILSLQEPLKDTLKDLKDMSSKFNSLKDTISNLKMKKTLKTNELQSLVDKKLNTVEVSKSDRDLLDKLNDDLNILYSEKNILDKKINNIQYISKELLPSSKFRVSVILKYILQLNLYLKDISSMILDNFIVQLELDKKETGIDVILKSGDDIKSYTSLSGGEKRRVDIVILLSIQKFMSDINNLSINVVCFDEIFDNLDSLGIELVVNCIKNIFDENYCIYVISHNEKVRSYFESVVVIENNNGVSSIVSGG